MAGAIADFQVGRGAQASARFSITVLPAPLCLPPLTCRKDAWSPRTRRGGLTALQMKG
jgi:hypothetical protein